MDATKIQIGIAILTIMSAWGISFYQIRAGRKLNAENLKINKENAGKNRVIYAVEQLDIEGNSKEFDEKLNKRLNDGNFTILAAFVNDENRRQTRYVLGKIKP